MTDWEWFAGPLDEVEADGFFPVGGCPTREAAIAAARAEYGSGVALKIICARSSTDKRHEGADIVPFVRVRLGEVIPALKLALA